MYKLLAVDPGKITGWCLIEAPHVLLRVGQCRGSCGVELEMAATGPAVVVVESYRIAPFRALRMGGERAYAAEVYGAVVAAAERLGAEVVEQLPGAKAIVPDWLLERIGGWRATVGLPHARDALRHAVYYLLRRHPLEFSHLVEAEDVGGVCGEGEEDTLALAAHAAGRAEERVEGGLRQGGAGHQAVHRGRGPRRGKSNEGAQVR